VGHRHAALQHLFKIPSPDDLPTPQPARHSRGRWGMLFSIGLGQGRASGAARRPRRTAHRQRALEGRRPRCRVQARRHRTRGTGGRRPEAAPPCAVSRTRGHARHGAAGTHKANFALRFGNTPESSVQPDLSGAETGFGMPPDDLQVYDTRAIPAGPHGGLGRWGWFSGSRRAASA
jgi:hypothetical protein